MRKTYFLAVIFIVVLAGLLRMEAVRKLPVDFDELTYLPVAFRYQEALAARKWKEIRDLQENLEHPPLNKLIFAMNLWWGKTKRTNVERT